MINDQQVKKLRRDLKLLRAELQSHFHAAFGPIGVEIVCDYYSVNSAQITSPIYPALASRFCKKSIVPRC